MRGSREKSVCTLLALFASASAPTPVGSKRLGTSLHQRRSVRAGRTRHLLQKIGRRKTNSADGAASTTTPRAAISPQRLRARLCRAQETSSMAKARILRRPIRRAFRHDRVKVPDAGDESSRGRLKFPRRLDTIPKQCLSVVRRSRPWHKLRRCRVFVIAYSRRCCLCVRTRRTTDRVSSET